MKAKLPSRLVWRMAFLLAAPAGLAHAQNTLLPGGGANPRNMAQNGGITFTGSDTSGQQLDPPLELTAEGQPIDSMQSPNATLSYVNHEVQSRAKIKHFQTPEMGNAGTVDDVMEVDLPAGLDTAMIPVVAKFGTTNLLEARRMKPSPRTQEGDRADNLLKDYETKIILEALKLAVTDNDLEAMTAAADKDPEVLAIIMSRPAWRGNSQLNDLVSQKLDALTDNDFTDASVPLLQGALASPDSATSGKASDFVQRWMDKISAGPTSDSSSSMVSYLQSVALKDLMVAGIETPSDTCATLFASWATMEQKQLSTQQFSGMRSPPPQPQPGMPGQPGMPMSANPPGSPAQPNDFTLPGVIMEMAQKFKGNPAAFEQKGLRDGVQTFLGSGGGKAGLDSAYDFLNAGLGNADAFRVMAQAYSRVPSAPGPGSPSAPGVDQTPAQGPVGMMNNEPNPQGPGANQGSAGPINAPAFNQALRRQGFPGPGGFPGTSMPPRNDPVPYAQSLMKQVTYVGPGDKAQGIASNLDHAVYNNGKWTVTASADTSANQPQPTSGVATPPGGGATPQVMPSGPGTKAQGVTMAPGMMPNGTMGSPSLPNGSAPAYGVGMLPGNGMPPPVINPTAPPSGAPPAATGTTTNAPGNPSTPAAPPAPTSAPVTPGLFAPAPGVPPTPAPSATGAAPAVPAPSLFAAPTNAPPAAPGSMPTH